MGTKDFGVTTVLGYVGLTSISAIKLAVQLNKKYGITVDYKLIGGRLFHTKVMRDEERWNLS